MWLAGEAGGTLPVGTLLLPFALGGDNCKRLEGFSNESSSLVSLESLAGLFLFREDPLGGAFASATELTRRHCFRPTTWNLLVRAIISWVSSKSKQNTKAENSEPPPRVGRSKNFFSCISLVGKATINPRQCKRRVRRPAHLKVRMFYKMWFQKARRCPSCAWTYSR